MDYFPNNSFRLGSAEITETVAADLIYLTQQLKKYPADRVVITGHTDDVGDEEDNLVLGIKRAEAAKGFLVQQGVEASRIDVRSEGESNPIVPNDTEANRKLNRRVSWNVIVNADAR